MLANTDLSESKATKSPMDLGYDRLPHDAQLNDEEASRYRSIVGKLLYLAAKTRPNLALTASKLGSRDANSMSADSTAAKRALRYCHGKIHMFICLRPSADNHLKAQVNAE